MPKAIVAQTILKHDGFVNDVIICVFTFSSVQLVNSLYLERDGAPISSTNSCPKFEQYAFAQSSIVLNI